MGGNRCVRLLTFPSPTSRFRTRTSAPCTTAIEALIALFNFLNLEAQHFTPEAALQRAEQWALARAIRETLAREPMHPSAERDLALTLHRLQELEEAEALYRRLLVEHPEDDVLRANLARLLMTRGAHELALDALWEGRSRPEHAATLDCLAGRILAHYLDRQAEAVRAYRACAAADGHLEPLDRDVLDRAQR